MINHRKNRHSKIFEIITPQWIQKFYTLISHALSHFVQICNQNNPIRRNPFFREVKKTKENNMTTLNLEDTRRKIDSTGTLLDSTYWLNLKKGNCNKKKKEIVKELVNLTRIIDKIGKKIEQEWEELDENGWKLVSELLPKVVADVNKTYKILEWEIDTTVERSLKFLLRCLEKLKIILCDTLEFRNIAYEIRASRENSPDLKRLDFAKRIIANAQAKTKGKQKGNTDK